MLPAVIDSTAGAATPLSTSVVQAVLLPARLVSLQFSVVLPLVAAVNRIASPGVPLVITAPVPEMVQAWVIPDTVGTEAALPVDPSVMFPPEPAVIVSAVELGTPVSTSVLQAMDAPAVLDSVQLSVVVPLLAAVNVGASPVNVVWLLGVKSADDPEMDQVCVIPETVGTEAALPVELTVT